MTTISDELAAAGVAVWLDDLSRPRVVSGDLSRMVAAGTIVGITTNPTIFASALSKGDLYKTQLKDLAEQGADVDAAVFTITTDDVRRACDVLRPVFDWTGGQDG